MPSLALSSGWNTLTRSPTHAVTEPVGHGSRGLIAGFFILGAYSAICHVGRWLPCTAGDISQGQSPTLNLYLSILRDLIFDSSVDRGILNFAAAPLGPNTRPRHSFRAASIRFFSCAKSLSESSIWSFDSATNGSRGSQLSSIEKI